MTDHQDIWHRLKAGEQEALGHLFYLFYADLFQYGIHLFHQEVLVEDQIQQLFLRLWEKRPSLPDQVRVKPYLIRSLRYALLDELRRQKRQPTLSIDALSPTFELVSLPDDQTSLYFENTDLQAALQAALQTLSPVQQEILFLRFYNQIPYQEIAEIVGMKYQSVRNATHQAMKVLREKMGQSKKSE